MSDVFKGAALKVAHNFQSVGGDAEAAIDPTQILAWIEVLKEVITMIQDCRKARDIPAISANPSVLERRLLTAKVRRVLGLREFLKNGRPTVDAILKTGAESTAEEIQQLYDEV